jgi:PKD repeat protein
MDKRIIFVIAAVLLAIISFIVIHKFTKKEKTEVTYLIKNIKLNKANIDSTIYFEDNTENATAWKWNFGDDQYSFEKAPSHIYTKKGEYRITLTVSGPFGDARDTSKVITITNLVPDTNNIALPVEIEKPIVKEIPIVVAKKEPEVVAKKQVSAPKQAPPAIPKKLKPAPSKSHPTSAAKEVQIAPSGYERIEK